MLPEQTTETFAIVAQRTVSCLRLDPVAEGIDVLRSGESEGLFDLDAVRP